ncbi:MAG: hypothetical protein ACUVTL_11250 [Thermoproteota archaeon]
MHLKPDDLTLILTGNSLPARPSKHVIRLRFSKLVHISYLEGDIDISLGKMKAFTATTIFR